MNIFRKLRSINDKFFDGLKQGAVDRALQKANLERIKELKNKAKELGMSEDEMDELFKNNSLYDAERFINNKAKKKIENEELERILSNIPKPKPPTD